ncbi:hypothetical protein GRZ55_11285 [Chelativorans sp. ZYF759]|uniref:hypothetical protein n=1 Tax=Chelativorans sp. ZYF759 TaxID=2692213 RepID=UPI00145D2CA2|nr:hypothetical protein [Chelativorans sp. ZYF759]NMG39827.1 hypothetical protein [Chelativorans sp. ZYF759]
MIQLPRFSADDAERAFDEWGANCGPGAIAAICGLTLDELRPHMGDFETKRYTNPTLMWQVLAGLGVAFSYRGGDLGRASWPQYGLARIQWEGPWTAPGVPIRARYRQTHWVGAARHPERGVGIFDINAIGNGTGWCALADWETTLVPFILSECVPRADGNWHITHAVEVKR